MAHKKSKDSKVYTFDPEVKPSYKQLFKAFSEMHAYSLSAFKKISLQRKLISKLESEINDLNSALNLLKKEHVSLVVENFNASDTLVEKVVKINGVTCSILKLENENLKEQLAQAISLSTTSYTSSSEKMIFFFEKNLRLARRNRKKYFI